MFDAANKNTRFLKMTDAPISKKRKRGTSNQKTGLIGVFKNGKRYSASMHYGGRQHYLGTFDTKEQAGIAYDRFVADKSDDEVSFTLNYPTMSDAEREEALKVEPVGQKKRGKRNQKTGLIGVSKNAKNGKKYQAYIQSGGRQHGLGTYTTKEQAGIAYDRAAIGKSTEELPFTLNYPNMTDPEREEALKVEPPPKKKRKRGTCNHKTGLIGVVTSGKKYAAVIWSDGKKHYLGTFDTKEHAGIAYDRVAIDKSTEEVSYTLNYPNMSAPEREEALKVKESGPKKRGKRNQKTGLIGVSKKKKRYKAQLKYGGTQHFLGTFDTKEQAGMAYDRFVVDKSTDEVSFTLNYPRNGLPTIENKGHQQRWHQTKGEPEAATLLLLKSSH